MVRFFVKIFFVEKNCGMILFFKSYHDFFYCFLKYYYILLYFQLFLPQKWLKIQNIQQFQLFLPQKWLKIPKNGLKKNYRTKSQFLEKNFEDFLDNFFGGKKSIKISTNFFLGELKIVHDLPHDFFTKSRKSTI